MMNIADILTPKRRARFLSRIEVRGEDECWPWTGGNLTKFGYGQMQGSNNYRKWSLLAHRGIWFCTHAREPIDIIRHTCDNPLCCNPAHLVEGSYADNSADMVSRGRHRRGEARAYPLATKERAIDMRLAGATCVAIAAALGCHVATAQKWTYGIPVPRKLVATIEEQKAASRERSRRYRAAKLKIERVARLSMSDDERRAKERDKKRRQRARARENTY